MIEIKNLKKAYENVTPIENITCTINKGDAISIIGPSGTGKSTLLRMINMLERPTSGQIIVDGEDITAEGYPLNKLREKVGMVFQSFNLFNHMTVIENVCYGPIVIKHMKKDEAFDKGMQLLNMVGLANFAFSYPGNLSGGQKQRAAIARTLAMDPEIILFDEPTSALDPTKVAEVESVIKELKDQGYTMMLVTHDMKLAEKMANRVFYLDEGGIYEDGTPEQIFRKPLKEKTKVFIKRLKDINCHIDSTSYDFPALRAQIDQFAYKNEIPYEEAKKNMAIVEELVYGILMPKFIDGQSSIDLNLSYSDLLKDTRITAEWKNMDVNLTSPENKISMDIINLYENSIKSNENYIRIKVKDVNNEEK
ncbi:MAG: amino acid ABC transporter ATP-binding protein [Bacillota bacterium]|nr:amino acid ABC transporter ATP-binding protein [Bacillota bacterium]